MELAPDQFEVATRTLRVLLDLAVPREATSPEKVLECGKIAQRRILTLAWMLRTEDRLQHMNGAQIARAFGVTKQAVNLDVQHISKMFGFAAPSARRTINGRAPGWCRRGPET